MESPFQTIENNLYSNKSHGTTAQSQNVTNTPAALRHKHGTTIQDGCTKKVCHTQPLWFIVEIS